MQYNQSCMYYISTKQFSNQGTKGRWSLCWFSATILLHYLLSIITLPKYSCNHFCYLWESNDTFSEIKQMSIHWWVTFGWAFKFGTLHPCISKATRIFFRPPTFNFGSFEVSWASIMHTISFESPGSWAIKKSLRAL